MSGYRLRLAMGASAFDAISASYAGLVEHDPSKVFVQFPWAIQQVAGRTQGARILDIGCGEGALSRILAREGALVCGYDNSSAQIEAAQQEEYRQPLGVEYLLADPRDVGAALGGRRFDVALAVTVLHYAEDADHLAAFFSSTYELLRPGGLFAALVFNPDFARWDTRLYGRRYCREVDGRLRVDFFDGEELSCSAHYSDFSRAEYEAAAAAAGWEPMTWLPVGVTVEGRRELGEFWSGFEEDCPYAGFKLSKPRDGSASV